MGSTDELPFELIFNPRWWHQTAGISFTRDFYFDPATRVRNDVIMQRVLHERFGDIGLGEADPQPRPVAGSLYVAGGFVIPALLGAEILFEPDAKKGFAWADDVETLLDLTELKLLDQADALIHRLVKREAP